MGKYGIGARVRDDDGDEGVIVDKQKGERLVKYGSLGFDCWMPKSALSVVDAWQPKVGDKIRWLGKMSATMLTKDKVYEIVKDKDNYSSYFGITDDDQATGNHSAPAEWLIEHFELVASADSVVAEVSAPLTIETGKFYRTRDGRKVLVQANTGDETFPWFSDINGWHGHDAKGNSCLGRGDSDDDIVAEWIDEPVVPEPKFKKGDRVICVNADHVSSISIGSVYVADGADENYVYLSSGGWDHSRFAPAPTDFQVGDVVRRVSASSWPKRFGEVGNEYVVLDIARGCPVVIEGSQGASRDAFELVRRPPAVAVAEPAKPAYIATANPGDTVRCEEWRGCMYDAGTDYVVGSTVEQMDLAIGKWSFVRSAPLPAIGTKVTLTATVTGHNPVDKTNINVVVDGLPAGRNSICISPSALKAA